MVKKVKVCHRVRDISSRVNVIKTFATSSLKRRHNKLECFVADKHFHDRLLDQVRTKAKVLHANSQPACLVFITLGC